ncbi:hypothetical protein RhiTH_009125 [Rhizoctonia solani]|uniref:CCHC-type domain-containing protein n=1 Tax=Rhizoctonia solani TaxID=456999 RepID=A0A8H7H206_9AGAM|nr:hypothetical protein RHS04_08973 [Rhizoctonia solani]
MATCSQPPSRSQTQVYAGDMGSQLLPAPTLDKYNVKEATLEWVIHLLWGVQGQLDCLKQKIGEQAKAIKEVHTHVKGISQTINGIEARIPQAPQPSTPEDWKAPPMVKETPQPLPKTKPTQEAIHLALAGQTRSIPGLYQPTPIKPICAPMSPLYSDHSIHTPTPPPPAAVTAATPSYTAVKVDHPRPYKGKVGSKAKQWLTCMLAWVWLNQRMFPTQVEILLFLLMNMDKAASAWAHPHVDLLGSHCAIIQTTDDFKREFLVAFGDLDATRAAEQKITLLTQTGTCANYITKFCTLNAALVINNTLQEECASHPPKGLKSGSLSTPNRGASTSQHATTLKKLSDNPNFVSEEEHNRCCAKGACIKCGKMGHKFAKCWTGWKASPKDDKGKPKEAAKIGKESGPKLGKD